MTTARLEQTILLAGCAGFCWLAIYLFTRDTTRRPVVFASIAALLGQAAFFGSSLLVDTAGSDAIGGWGRLFWWSAVVPVAVWFHAARLFADPAARRRVGPHPTVALAYVAALILAVGGSASEAFLRYGAPVALGDGVLALPAGPLYPLYLLYLALATGGAGAVLAWGWWRRRGRRPGQLAARQLGQLTIGALGLTAGALWLAVRRWSGLALDPLPGDIILCAVLPVLGHAIARYSLLLGRRETGRDFAHAATGALVLLGAYMVVLTPAGLHGPRPLLGLVLLVVCSHAGLDAGRSALDRLFYSTEERLARAEARAYAITLGTAPVVAPSRPIRSDPAATVPTHVPTLVPTATLVPLPIAARADSSAMGSAAEPMEPMEPMAPAAAAVEVLDEAADAAVDAAADAAADEAAVAEEPDEDATEWPAVVGGEAAFRAHVRKAITGIKNPPKLAESPLLALPAVGERLAGEGKADNRLNRTSALRGLLREQIHALRPSDDPGTGVGDAWRFYHVLHLPYEEEISPKDARFRLRQVRDARKAAGGRTPSDDERVLEWFVEVDENTYYKWQRKAANLIATNLLEELARRQA